MSSCTANLHHIHYISFHTPANVKYKPKINQLVHVYAPLAVRTVNRQAVVSFIDC